MIGFLYFIILVGILQLSELVSAAPIPMDSGRRSRSRSPTRSERSTSTTFSLDSVDKMYLSELLSRPVPHGDSSSGNQEAQGGSSSNTLDEAANRITMDYRAKLNTACTVLKVHHQTVSGLKDDFLTDEVRRMLDAKDYDKIKEEIDVYSEKAKIAREKSRYLSRKNSRRGK